MTPNFETVFTDLPAKKADLIILILTSQHIDARVEKQNRLFDIQVLETNKDAALSAVDTYFSENKFFRLKQKVQEFPISSFKSYPTFFIMALLFFIHALCLHYKIHENMILKYGSSALFILQGETYRAITALFLHADARHLAGNMAGMLIFGAPVISLSGFGTGPLMLLAAGTLGNLINAGFYKTAHLSIGASTAVMGAAGMLAAYQITQKNRPIRLNSLMPLFAGAILVALLSQGDRTDVWAHVFGFLCGLSIGTLFFPLNRMLRFPQKDPMALILTLLIMVSAFLSAA